MIDEALQDHCLSDATLRRLVADRIYPDFAPASAAVPYILRSRLSNPPHDHLGGEDDRDPLFVELGTSGAAGHLVIFGRGEQARLLLHVFAQLGEDDPLGREVDPGGDRLRRDDELDQSLERELFD